MQLDEGVGEQRDHALARGCCAWQVVPRPVLRLQSPSQLLLPRPPPTGNEGEEPLLGADGLRVLRACEELDYMTHIVLRMFENMT